MLNKLWDNIRFILDSNELKKRVNALRQKGKIKETLQDDQRRGMYRRWLKFLKKRKLYTRFREDIIYACNHPSGYDPSSALLLCSTREGILYQVKTIDKYFANNWIDGIRHYTRWEEIYLEFEGDAEQRKEVLCRKLYHMDAPQVIHHEYKGSYYPKKRLIDTIIDKILFIK